jgi:hypothetical protein
MNPTSEERQGGGDPEPDQRAKPKPIYVESQRRGRETLSRAAAADPPLRPREWRVLVAIVNLTALWGKVESQEAVSQIAAEAGFSHTEHNVRAVGRIVRDLARRRFISWKPGRGRPPSHGRHAAGAFVPSRVGLLPLERGARQTPIPARKGGCANAERWVRETRKRGSRQTPLPRL